MTNLAIIPENIQALGAIYRAAMLDEMKAFEVADQLLQVFQTGRLPVTGLASGDALFKSWKDARSAMPEARRRQAYWQAFGFGRGDDADVKPNREFSDLFVRFVSSVAAFARQVAAADTAAQPRPAASQEQVRKAARDLATNLSLHGYGMAGFAATDLQPQVESLLNLLSDPEIRRAYGARDAAQLVERVAELELGGAAARGNPLARGRSGAVIFAWLARRAPALAAAGTVLDAGAIKTRVRADDPARTPTDFDLVEACELWLADSAVADSEIETRARPAQTPEARAAVRTVLSNSSAFAPLTPAMQSRVARDTGLVADDLVAGFQDLIEGVDFPQFVTALVKGVFDAIVDASIQQMEAYADLIASVAASLDQYRDETITDESARDYLRESSPLLRDPPRRDEEQRIAKALDGIAGGTWRRLANKRQQLLATLVLIGVNRAIGSNKQERSV